MGFSVGIFAGERGLPVNLKGESVDPFEGETAEAVVFAFMADECPISNRYAPRMIRYAKGYGEKGVRFWSVYPDAELSVEKIRKHRADYGYEMDAMRDLEHWLVEKTGADVTPEVAIYDRLEDGSYRLVYLGRIDDQYLNYGKWRHQPLVKDLEETLDAVLGGEDLEFRKTRAVGCYIGE